MKSLILFAAPLILAGCNPSPQSPVTGGPSANGVQQSATPSSGSSTTMNAPVASDASAKTPATEPPSPANPANACDKVSGSGFEAWVNGMPGPSRKPTLIVIGKVITPTGGWKVSLGQVTVLESYPVQVVTELLLSPPSEGSTQAVVTHDVRGDWPSEERVGAVTVRCGAKTIARISPVDTVH